MFDLREQLKSDFAQYIESFIRVKDDRVGAFIREELERGTLYPDPLVQVNPNFEPGEMVAALAEQGVVHRGCDGIFRWGQSGSAPTGMSMRLHKHQQDAVLTANKGANYVLTTGTGSGKSLAYILPIVDHVLKSGSGNGIKAVVIYPMNALANSQQEELRKYLGNSNSAQVKFGRYTGQEKPNERQAMIDNPPDILLTNFMMLEYILSRPFEAKLVEHMRNLRFVVLDELHTYRGRQGADVALLVRRLKDKTGARDVIHVGTSATMATEGTAAQQREAVASVATRLFGAPVEPSHVIGESLKRWTDPVDIESADFRSRLADSLASPLPSNRENFRNLPLSQWIESAIGLDTNDEGKLKRKAPIPLYGDQGAEALLAEFCGIARQDARTYLEQHFQQAAKLPRDPESGGSAFAVRLHQFFSPGIGVFSTLEPNDVSFLSLDGQKSAPEDPTKILMPLAFCRSCGQHHFIVTRTADENGAERVVPRALSSRSKDANSVDGYIFIPGEDGFPDIESLIPDEWYEDGPNGPRVNRNRKSKLPQNILVHHDGTLGVGTPAWFIPAPLALCVGCGTPFSTRERDAAKLAVLGMQGRSTATTTLSISTINHLRQLDSIKEPAKKLLSFTDNRQDASLQAGHLNDFVELGLVRAALFAAVQKAGEEGLDAESVALRVMDELKLQDREFAKNPSELRTQQTQYRKALGLVIGYRIARDLRRGVRLNAPNLEQVGLLQVVAPDLPDIAQGESFWQGKHAFLVNASVETRSKVLRTLVDRMRQSLAINLWHLNPDQHEQIRQGSYNHLREPWALGDDEANRLDRSTFAYVAKSKYVDESNDVLLTPRSWFGMYLRNESGLFKEAAQRNDDAVASIIQNLLDILVNVGLVERSANDGYQVAPGAIRWCVGDPEKAEKRYRNPFFEDFYAKRGLGIKGISAAEHTAQVKAELRENRESKFRAGELPILFCSPTMELGVDIADLNVVNMRNIPPTPANYAQRSGRAGRSGQPALVYSYCTAGSPHDQFYFRRPELMVAGSVTPPRLDLTNQELVRAHVHAIWLGESDLLLGNTLNEKIINLAGEPPALELHDDVVDALNKPEIRTRTINAARRMLATIGPELESASWYLDDWIETVVNQIPESFRAACERWRHLYRTAWNQADIQHRRSLNHMLSEAERNAAQALERDAKNQIHLLTDSDADQQSDFYSYRYLASEGFLPGYNFPRLPLSAFIPGRKTKEAEFLSRPRFLAISEFGPGAVVYHEGSRYLVNKVHIPADYLGEDGRVHAANANVCTHCGYIHERSDRDIPNVCDRCQTPFETGAVVPNTMRLNSVTLRRKDRITCDEEERMRQGYELRTGIRFAGPVGKEDVQVADIAVDGVSIARLTYAPAATLWRINMGWNRREDSEQLGYNLDTLSGKWLDLKKANELGAEETETASERTRIQRVVPYVTDTRNALILEWTTPLDIMTATSLQSALKVAIQAVFQIEDTELAAEPLPNPKDRRSILLYESAEGGAGVLRRIVDEPGKLGEVARKALEICHYDPESLQDLRRQEKARYECSTACYDCLMSYGNQTDHAYLDRRMVVDVLTELRDAVVSVGSGGKPRMQQLQELMQRCDSDLERQWLGFIDSHRLNLPDASQHLIEEAGCKPDFVYRRDGYKVAIFVDGPPHDTDQAKSRDQAVDRKLEDFDWTVQRFRHDTKDEWPQQVRELPSVYGDLQ